MNFARKNDFCLELNIFQWLKDTARKDYIECCGAGLKFMQIHILRFVRYQSTCATLIRDPSVQ